MSRYKAPAGSRYDRRKQQKNRRMAMYSTIALFVLVLSFGIVKVIELFTADEEEIPLLDNTQKQEQQVKKKEKKYKMGPKSADL